MVVFRQYQFGANPTCILSAFVALNFNLRPALPIAIAKSGLFPVHRQAKGAALS